MKILDAINKFDSLVYNDFPQQDKIKWLSTMDGLVKREIIDFYNQKVEWKPYTSETDLATTDLLVPEPYDEIYMTYLEMQVHRYMQEYAKYNNAAELYTEMYSRYAADYARTHEATMPRFTYF